MSNISSTDYRPELGTRSSLPSALSGTHTQLIRCDIVFGMPSQDCRGTGICKLTSDLDQPPGMKKECRQTVAFAARSAEAGKITLLFFRELLCVDLFRRQFRNGVFEMPESCPLPGLLAEQLGVSGKSLLPGRYTITADGNCLTVAICCG